MFFPKTSKSYQVRYFSICKDRLCFVRLPPAQLTGTLYTRITPEKLRYHESLRATHPAGCTTDGLARVPQRAMWFLLRVRLHQCVCDGLYLACSTYAHAC